MNWEVLKNSNVNVKNVKLLFFVIKNIRVDQQ